jgi:UDP-N-acetylmuramate dehydrogenase
MKIRANISLKAMNTFGLDVKAAQFAECNSVIDLKEVLESYPVSTQALLVLGAGSNVLFTKDYEGLVLLNRCKGIEVEQENSEHVWLRCGAGEVWDKVVEYAVHNNWGGIENLSIIPGCCGAAPMQNIGAYGVELNTVFESLEALEIKTGKIRQFTASQCEFGYRESIFKHKVKGQFIITSLLLRLTKEKHYLNLQYGAINEILMRAEIKNPDIRAVRQAVIEIRTSKLPNPAELGNAGSFFKNPEISTELFSDIQAQYPSAPHYPLDNGMIKIPAGWMIEQCGWKGKKVGQTGAHANQALVLVNYGAAKGEEIYSLAMDIKASVFEKFKVEINPEVNIIR